MANMKHLTILAMMLLLGTMAPLKVQKTLHFTLQYISCASLMGKGLKGRYWIVLEKISKVNTSIRISKME